jgi:hypothetical protein
MEELQKDHIGTETRVVGGLVIVVLMLAFFALYVFPDQTDKNFAWTIKPRTTAILIGAGYTAGAYFFLRVITGKQWHRVQAGFLPITAFTIWMFVATIVHWSRFHQGIFPFYLWTVIYIITPFLVPFLWLRNRAGASPDLEENDLRFPASVRWVLGTVAVAAVLLFLVVFVKPSLFISAAPWQLTELTARVFAGWSTLTFLTVLMVAVDGRWSATRILIQSAMVGQVLAVLAFPRIWNDLDQSKPMATVFIVGLVVTLVLFGVIHVWIDQLSQRRRTILVRS